jgi:transcription antitermination protein NusB
VSARSKARKRALDVLFESEQRGVDPLATLAQRVAQGDPPVNPYAVTLVEGVVGAQREIDTLIGACARDWPLDRMPAVDRTVLRLGTWELLHGDVPAGVAIDEAVELAKSLSTDDSPAFVNGVLARVLDEHLRAAEVAPEVAGVTVPPVGFEPTPDGF